MSRRYVTEVMFRKIATDGGELSRSVSPISGAEQPIRRVGLRTLERTDLDRICARARCSEFLTPLTIVFEARHNLI